MAAASPEAASPQLKQMLQRYNTTYVSRVPKHISNSSTIVNVIQLRVGNVINR